MNPNNLFFNSLGNVISRSSDAGANWTTSFVSSAGTVNTLAIDPATPTTLYAGTNRGVFKSTNGAQTWAAANAGTTNENARVIAIDKNNPSIIYFGSSSGLFKSTDGAISWARNNSLGFFTVTSIALDPNNASTVYLAIAANSVIQKTIDGGNTWSSAVNGYSTVRPTSLVISPANSSTLFAATTSGSEAFAAKLHPGAGAEIYSTYLGGSSGDIGQSVVSDAAGNADLTGSTTSTDFPVLNAFQPTGASAAFFTKFGPSGTLLNSSYLGGNGLSVGRGIALDSANNIYIAGYTNAQLFPGASGLEPTITGGTSFDVFVTKLNPAASAILYTQSIGGGSTDQCFGLAVDPAGSVYITGTTSSSDFPVAGAPQPTKGTLSDAFATKLNTNGAISYSTYLGGGGSDTGEAIAIDGAGNTYVTGFTGSSNFPTANPLDGTYAGSNDVFVSKLGPAPDLVVAMTDSPDPVSFGADLTYNISVANNGELSATGVTVTDVVPLDSTLVSAIPTQGSCSASTTITCSLGTLGIGNSASISVVIKPPAQLSITNSATVTANEKDSNLANNSASQTTQVNFADLSIIMRSSTARSAPGSNFGYLITVRNNKGNTTNATISATLPPETSFVSCGGGTCSGTGNTRSVLVPNLAVGQSALVVIVAQVNSGVADGTVINNSATVAPSVPDSDPSNNSASSSMTAAAPLVWKGAGKVAYGTSHIFTAPADGSSAPVQFPVGTALSPSWAPDGVRLAYFNGGEIDIANLDGTSVVKAATNGIPITRIAWSPSGSALAYVGTDSALYIANADGSGAAKVPSSPTSVKDPDWSADGTKLLFSKDQDLFRMSIDGSGLTKVSNSSSGPDGPFAYVQGRWSPDMSKILAVRKSNNDSDVVIMNADGTGVTRALNIQAKSSSPSWSPDGTSIVYYLLSEVHTTKLDGSNDVKLASGEACCGIGITDWQPLPAIPTPPPPPPGPTFSISGHAPAFTFLVLSGTRSGSLNADSNGDYAFLNLPAGGSYTITPQSNLFIFSPANRTYAALSTNQTGADFVTAGPINYQATGQLLDANGAAIAGSQLQLIGGTNNLSAVTDSNGRYIFSNLQVGRVYSLFPSVNSTFSYTPNGKAFSFGDLANTTQVQDFIGYTNTPITISGRVTEADNPGVGVASVQVQISNAGKTTTTDANGNYSFTGLTPGQDYTVTVSAPSSVIMPTQFPFKAVVTNMQAYFVHYASRPLHTISGRAVTSDGTPLSFMPVTLSGDTDMTTITGGDGSYSFTNVPEGFHYIIRPYRGGLAFAPPDISLSPLAGDSSGNNFTASLIQSNGTNSAFQFASPFFVVSEGGGQATITVTRSGSGRAEDVSYSTANGTATDRSDYTFGAGTLHFAMNETAKRFNLLLTDDVLVENPETVFITLRASGAGELGQDSVAVLTITDNDNPAGQPNPADTASFFVRQHYLDFLNRQPDSDGLNFWTNQITSCGTDTACTEVKRINTSGAFFLSIEFQETGYLVERIYKTAFGDATGNSTFPTAHQLGVPIIRLNEFLTDTQQIGQGVVVLAPGWEQALETNKQNFLNGFVQRARFIAEYPGNMAAADYVDKLNTRAGNPLSSSERDQLVADLSGGGKTRAQVLRAIAEHPKLVNAEVNRAFVLMQFFGYLRRNPNDLPDSDHTGYDFWLTKLNQFQGNFVSAEMVKAFIASSEYRQRFGP